jgi:hypothetical protein
MVGNEAQFEFGSSTGSLNLVASEEILARLAKMANEAIERFHAIPEGENVDFSVTG